MIENVITSSGAIAQLAKQLMSMCEALGSVPSTEKTAMVTHVCNFSTQKIEAEVLGFGGQPWPNSELEASMGYRRPFLRKADQKQI